MPANTERTREEIDFLASYYKDLLLEDIFHKPELVVNAYKAFKPTMQILENQLEGVDKDIESLEILAAQAKYLILEPMKTIQKAAENFEKGKPYDPGEVAACLAIIIRAEMICYNQLTR